MKIVEAALDLDRDKAIKYINKFIIKFPESDLIYPFTHLLKWKKNPSGLGHGDIIHTSHPTNPSDANHHTCPECSWLCSCSDQPCRCCSDEHKTTTLPSDEVKAEEILKYYLLNKHHVFAASTSKDQIDAMRKDIICAMEEYASTKLAESEREMKEFRQLARLISALNEDHENFKCIAGHIQLARKLLTTTNP